MGRQGRQLMSLGVGLVGLILIGKIMEKEPIGMKNGMEITYVCQNC